MDIKKRTKESFSVIGNESSTHKRNSFNKELFEKAKEHYNGIEPFVKKDNNVNPATMSDFSRQLTPWEYFSCIFFNDKL